ncbi:probable 6-phosphogluconolactonase 4, chloroplastic [Vicia villosa]|uniref:probable 6-phosphogluconolactonase 4, chloroplastic n=1 Tax=Vicia villosa TaxID=3911 RepID=UPI00273C9498|nr:probable 6-phosphogluconolactonase 4, chloroplastic [Vicia villosa]
MSFLTTLSNSCTLQSSLFCAQKPNPLSLRTSTLPTQVGNKIVYQPLKHNKVFSPNRCVEKIKASLKNVEVFSKEHLAVSLAYDVAQLSTKFTKERGAFTVALSGGSLIKYLRKLVDSPYAKTIDWSKWHVFWVDERVVPKDNLESNYKLAKDGFLSKVPIPSLNVYSIDDSLPPDDGAAAAADAYETTLRRLVTSNVIASTNDGLPKFDLMLLGMGPDGHVASLFPGHSLLNEDQKWVSFLNDSPKQPLERITFTFPVINASSNVAMVVTGAGKSTAVYTALEDDAKTVKLPVEKVSPYEGELKWYLDKGAASKLFKE